MSQYLTEQNIPVIVSAIVALSSFFSALLQIVGLTTASKLVGGLPVAFDLGGLLRWYAKKRATAVKAALGSLFLLLPLGCRPTRAPSVPEAAIAAVNVVDTALAKYIETAPDTTRVNLPMLAFAVERAGVIAARKGDPCLVVDDLTYVGSEIGCSACVQVSRELVRLANCEGK